MHKQSHAQQFAQNVILHYRSRTEIKQQFHQYDTTKCFLKPLKYL